MYPISSPSCFTDPRLVTTDDPRGWSLGWIRAMLRGLLLPGAPGSQRGCVKLKVRPGTRTSGLMKVKPGPPSGERHWRSWQGAASASWVRLGYAVKQLGSQWEVWIRFRKIRPLLMFVYSHKCEVGFQTDGILTGDIGRQRHDHSSSTNNNSWKYCLSWIRAVVTLS